VTVIINPGSGPVTDGEGWTNTMEVATATAQEWLASMHAEGMTDVRLLPGVTRGWGCRRSLKWAE